MVTTTCWFWEELVTRAEREKGFFVLFCLVFLEHVNTSCFSGAFFLSLGFPQWGFRRSSKAFERQQLGGKQYHTSHGGGPQSQALKLK